MPLRLTPFVQRTSFIEQPTHHVRDNLMLRIYKRYFWCPENVLIIQLQAQKHIIQDDTIRSTTDSRSK